jgi:hypothetical protein
MEPINYIGRASLNDKLIKLNRSTRVVRKIRFPMIFHNEKHVYWYWIIQRLDCHYLGIVPKKCYCTVRIAIIFSGFFFPIFFINVNKMLRQPPILCQHHVVKLIWYLLKHIFTFQKMILQKQTSTTIGARLYLIWGRYYSSPAPRATINIKYIKHNLRIHNKE